MKVATIAIAIIQLFLISCSKDSVPPTATQDPLQSKFFVDYYDITMEVDADQLLFRSDQSVTIEATTRVEEFEFELHADLVIDDLTMSAPGGTQIPITWEQHSNIKDSRGTEEELFERYAVQVSNVINLGETRILTVSYHMQASAIHNTLSNELLKFTISETGSRALHPVSGTFPYFGGLVAAPFRFSMKHPAGQHSSIPGNLVETTTEGQYVVDVYEAEIPLIPVFYVNACERIVRNQDGIGVEFLLASDQSMPDAVIDHTFAVARLYNELFGDPGTVTYRFAYIDVPSSSTTGESKGNAIYFARRSGDSDVWDDASIANFVQLVSHELFHNWNIWSVHWQGKLYEWFVEGGAGFMSAWASQNVLGEEAGRSVRNGFINGYHDHQGYTATRTLENAQKQGQAEISLIYSYGALVWEQLRRKLGDEAFFAGLNDFFTDNFNKPANSDDLLAALEARAGFPVDPYLDQWIKHNAQIDLSIAGVDIQSQGGAFAVEVRLQTESDRDYEIFTQIGYRTSAAVEMQMIDVRIEQPGEQVISFTTNTRPVYIQVDPDRCVPQDDLNNDDWED